MEVHEGGNHGVGWIRRIGGGAGHFNVTNIAVEMAGDEWCLTPNQGCTAVHVGARLTVALPF